ncbi:HNH endonuclease [Mycolicibacillus parakoreensis]|uniref:HNH endonuclease n=1 Tax=Mycolicibacillus parakoreensis TaxID=1069221 RepID=A0ABY3U1G2_9MYCO|nr:HNH endonuclease [Mycolicibacillus parakoreensis]MCV7314805.1 HNH endonuclease [Mycolicibacillus parakoreensis]ULN53805.1 HNH endonuclease [Mycolicibacillus parakoreensis]
MAQHTNRRGHRSSGAATGRTGATGVALRSVPAPVAASDPWGRRRVLLLNASYEPLTALPMRRAIVMLVCGKADTVHEDTSGGPAGPVIHSETLAVTLPSVIRLRHYVRVPYRARVPMTRAALMHRDRFCCAYCGSRADTVDHVVPRSRGGAHGWENCVACCSTCNRRKADRLLSELGWSLRRPPTTPIGQHWRLRAAITDLDPAWSRYLGEGAA